jgi:dihydropyrimidinase
LLDDSVFARPDGHLYACCPQVKKPKDIERLWKGLVSGEVCIVSTDTCTFTKAQKARWEGDWTKIPMGMPGLETLLPLMYTQGVLGKRITLEQFVQKCCTNPAKVMGLYPQKGVIKTGSDADIAIFDPDKKIKVDHATMETGADWNPYQGMEFAGFAQHTFSRGKQIVNDYKCIDAKGWGKWLPREKAGAL